MKQIKNRWTGEIISEAETIKEAVQNSSDLRHANLYHADLYHANLCRANLRHADLRCADLRGVDLRHADLRNADLRNADLREANFQNAKIRFNKFPSLAFLSCINLGAVSDELALELMRWDANCHPDPEIFDVWKDGGQCPYQHEERFWLFQPERAVWKPGKPTMTGYELIMAICKEKNWKIRGHLG